MLNPEKDKKGRGNDGPIDFTAALHTYVEVLDASKKDVLVRGLDGKRKIDKAIDPAKPQDTPANGDMTFGEGLFDRVYLETEPETMLHVGTGAAVAVENTAGWTDTVVWNPTPPCPAASGSDSVCVESAAISEKVTLKPEDVWRAETNLTVVDL